ncbi:MAG: hypothetical protein IJ446_10055 [Oscillospiraceae bacterium]|nr:hypothetical protein [Oscillospiraceae bacterium]
MCKIIEDLLKEEIEEAVAEAKAEANAKAEEKTIKTAISLIRTKSLSPQQIAEATELSLDKINELIAHTEV